MGKIKKLIENDLQGGASTTEIYPVTSTKAVYDTNNKSLDDRLNEIDNRVQIIKDTSEVNIN